MVFEGGRVRHFRIRRLWHVSLGLLGLRLVGRQFYRVVFDAAFVVVVVVVVVVAAVVIVVLFAASVGVVA